MTKKEAIDRWHQWASDYIVKDLQASHDRYPVPLLTDQGWRHGEKSQQFDQLESTLPDDAAYVYILYMDDQPEKKDWTLDRIRPLYVGETGDLSGRFSDHITRLQDSDPAGTEDSWDKYDHLAAILEQSNSSLYLWTRPNSEINVGPYGYNCHSEELEGKLVGLLHRIPPLRRTLINREYVPNWSHYYRNMEQTDWISFDPPSNVYTAVRNVSDLTPDISKQALWLDWLDQYLLKDLNNTAAPDPIPLFETASDGHTVQVTTDEVLARSDMIENQIQIAAQACMDDRGPADRDREGLLYIMYQLDNLSGPVTYSDLKPLYIGKAEVWGKKQQLSNNFTNFLPGHTSTREFARWGDGPDWHIGKLSNAVRTGSEGHIHWAKALFEPESRRLREETYLWVHVWNRSKDIGPYHTASSLATVESQLIAMAYENSPNTLLNKDGVPKDVPINQTGHCFKPPDKWPKGGSKQRNLGEF